MIDKNKDLRKNIAHSSFLAGLAISHTRTSICHSISYPLTLRHGIDHGLACAFSMLEVYKFNKDFIKEDIEYLTNFLKEDPYIALQNIYKKHQIEKMISELLPKESEFFVSIEDFITEGRFENNIKHCQDDDLISIITNSYYRLRSY
jgi:alcohol dehydrogenase class IV